MAMTARMPLDAPPRTPGPDCKNLHSASPHGDKPTRPGQTRQRGTHAVMTFHAAPPRARLCGCPRVRPVPGGRRVRNRRNCAETPAATPPCPRAELRRAEGPAARSARLLYQVRGRFLYIFSIKHHARGNPAQTEAHTGPGATRAPMGLKAGEPAKGPRSKAGLCNQGLRLCGKRQGNAPRGLVVQCGVARAGARRCGQRHAPSGQEWGKTHGRKRILSAAVSKGRWQAACGLFSAWQTASAHRVFSVPPAAGPDIPARAATQVPQTGTEHVPPAEARCILGDTVRQNLPRAVGRAAYHAMHPARRGSGQKPALRGRRLRD